LTEVPEHLLARSRARRAGLAGGGDAAAPAPATTSEAAPAATAAAAAPAPVVEAAPKPAEPMLPWVEAGESRRRIPAWAVVGLVALVPWAVMYAFTNDPQSPKAAGPLTTGATTYTTCAACHGGAGEGGVGPKLAGGDVVKAFPDPYQQVRWVILGTAGFQAEGTTTYGEDKKPVGGIGVMPAQGDGLTPEQLLGVVRHERETLSGEDYDAGAWSKVADEMKADKNPKVSEKAEEYGTVIEGWKDLPPGS
jgi:mono/diheme cytochrome c family protein